MTLLLSACLEAIKGTRANTKSAKELVSAMLTNLNWLSDTPTMAEDIIISSFSTVKLLACLMNLQYQLRINPEELSPIARVIENTLLSGNLDRTQRSVILNQMIHLVEQPIKPIPILLATLDESNPLLFYNNSRVIVTFTSQYALELCQHGIIDSYLKNPILRNSNRFEKLVFYSIDG
jgi:hypothetical protein